MKPINIKTFYRLFRVIRSNLSKMNLNNKIICFNKFRIKLELSPSTIPFFKMPLINIVKQLANKNCKAC